MINKKGIVLFICVTIALIFFFTYSPPPKRGLLFKIPIQFDPSQESPLITANIEEAEYKLLLDWGLPGAWALQKKSINKLRHTTIEGSFHYRDIKGNAYTSRALRLPIIEIADLDFKNVLGVEENDTFITEGVVLWDSDNQKDELCCIDGKIGRDLFKDWNLLFDFAHKALYLTHAEISDFKKAYCRDLKKFAELPFEESRNGTVISIDTDLGTKRFLLDTGATKSFLRRSLVHDHLAYEIKPDRWVYTSKKFRVGKVDFGETSFFLFELTSLMNDVDGILGINFFIEHPIYLDFRNKSALIAM